MDLTGYSYSTEWPALLNLSLKWQVILVQESLTFTLKGLNFKWCAGWLSGALVSHKSNCSKSHCALNLNEVPRNRARFQPLIQKNSLSTASHFNMFNNKNKTNGKLQTSAAEPEDDRITSMAGVNNIQIYFGSWTLLLLVDS